MVKCECGNVISNGVIIKGIAVVQISKDKKEVNIKCRKCKRWVHNVPISDLLSEE
jgi:hypothetical protein